MFDGRVLMNISSTATIYPFLFVRWLSFQRLAPLLSAPTPDPASATSRSQLLPLIRCLKQFLQPSHWLPITQQSAHEDPPALCLAHPQCHPHRQPLDRHAGA